ncbi:MAG TPA: right-handed parallel beta-helix repeat-containing protein [Pyrinomonadaceae bacterium]
MNNLPRQKLLEIVRRHGRAIISEPRRCEGLMRDHFPTHRREIAVLTAALEERIPDELLATGSGRMPRGALLARLTARLHNDLAIEEVAARWSVNTWALALDIINPGELDAIERADAQAHAPEDKPAPPEQAAQPARAGTGETQPRAIPRATQAIPARSASPAARTSFVVSPDGSGDFLTLTEAIRRVHAGSRLVVRPGIYNEGLVIDKSLEIVGEGAVEEIIVRATVSSCLVMRTDAATIRNLSLRGQARAGGAHGDGFFAVDIPHGRLLLDGCDISSDSLACVAIHNPTAAPVIRGCRIHHGVDSGVFAFDGAQGVIEACDISENSNIGIALTGGAGTGVRACHIHHGADAGIVVWDRAANSIEGCDIYANRRTNVGVSDAGVATLNQCRIHDGENTGVYVHRSGSATLEGCNIHGHAEPEVAVTGGGDVRLRDCQIHDGSSHGVFVQNAGRALLEACDVFRNRVSGLHVDANGAAIARACRINDNGHVAVNCEAGGEVEVEGCDLTGNRVAAWLTDHGSLVKSRNNRL